MIEGTRVIDYHGHVGRWERYGMVDDPELLLGAMDAVGIDIACLFHIFHPDGTTGNDLTARFVAGNPDRFVGFAYVSPTMPGRMVPELERAIDKLGFPAIKLYPPYTPWPFNEDPWHPIYAFAQDRGLPIILHTDHFINSRPRYFEDLAPAYPRVSFVSAHCGNVPEARAEAIAAARKYPNVYLETCSTYRTPGVIEELVEKGGADRVLYGSDMPLMDPRPQIGKIITARIPPEAKRMALGENAARLLGI